MWLHRGMLGVGIGVLRKGGNMFSYQKKLAVQSINELVTFSANFGIKNQDALSRKESDKKIRQALYPLKI